MSDTIKSVGKHLLLWVPDFGESPMPVLDDAGKPTFETRKLTSFLRLGAPSPDLDSDPGADLLSVINDCGQPGDPRLDAAQALVDAADALEAKDSTQKPKADELRAEATKLRADVGVPEGAPNNGSSPWKDDVRHRSPGDPGHGMTVAQRLEETGRLHSRGGWRDHSDGNRITTTRGDKVEVIRGNYKMVVMGRQDDPGEAMGWEIAGSHLNDYAPGTMPGASVFQEFIEDYVFKTKDQRTGEDIELKGVWLLVNSTENVWQYSRNAGNFRDEHWGDLHENYVGSENPADISTHPDDGMSGHPEDTKPYKPGANDAGARAPWSATSTGRVRSNPHIISKTWAKKIEEYTGSSKLPVPSTYSETWADETDEKTTITNAVTSTTTVGGAVTETTTVGGAVTETTTVGGAVTSTTTVGGAQMEFTQVGGVALASTIVGAAQIELTGVAGAIVGVTGSPVAASLDVHAFKLEMAVTGIQIALAVTGLHLDLSASIFKLEESKEKWDVSSSTKELKAMQTEIALTRQHVNTQTTALQSAQQELITQKTQINTLYDVQSGAVFLA